FAVSSATQQIQAEHRCRQRPFGQRLLETCSAALPKKEGKGWGQVARQTQVRLRKPAPIGLWMPSFTMIRKDQQRGMVLGLAIGDALGAAVQFKPPGTFPEVTGFRAGGAHRLQAGAWTVQAWRGVGRESW